MVQCAGTDCDRTQGALKGIRAGLYDCCCGEAVASGKPDLLDVLQEAKTNSL